MKDSDKVRCSRHKGCINDICEHLNPHEKIHSCGLSTCSYALGDIVKCNIDLKKERRLKLEKLNLL